MSKSSDFLSSRAAADELGVSLTTVQHWVEIGVLRAWKTAGGHRRIARNSVDELLRKQQEAMRDVRQARNLRVVLVDDDQLLQQIYELKFEEWNLPIDLTTANNGFEGLLEIGHCKPDVIIADLDMPGMDGFEMIRAISEKSELQNARIIVVTGLDKSDIEVRGELPDDVPVLGKPVIFEELRQMLAGAAADQLVGAVHTA